MVTFVNSYVFMSIDVELELLVQVASGRID